MAEGLTRRALSARGIEVGVSSCGMLDSGRLPPPEVVSVMSGRGVEIGEHRSRQMSREIIAGASLILGMERQHVREIVMLEPGAFTRTFTLPEIVRRFDVLAEAELPGDGPMDLAGMLGRIAADRTRRDLLGSAPDDEIDDPIGRPMRAFVKAADEIEDLVGRLLAHLWPLPADTDAGETGTPGAVEAPPPSAPEPRAPASAATPSRIAMREEARQRRAAALRGPVRRPGRRPGRSEGR